MTRSTIDYGADLGTTTSAIAGLRGTESIMIPNKDGALFTPSAVYIDKRGTTHVGRVAKERYFADEANCDIEFKLRMRPCADGPKVFRDSGRKMTPAQLSAEVLKSLRADVQSQTDEDLRAMVITVPADFDVPQNMQTEEAARLAGIETAPLLQEPVAAALAYGFQSRGEDAYWMVYDFGGGTFDAAIVKVEDDFVQVVQHAGDNCLGGKLIDWEIVDKLLVPCAQELAHLRDFDRLSEAARARWALAFAKLKHEAEIAKVEISRLGRARKIYIPELLTDAKGRAVDFEFELTPEALQAVFQPYIVRSLNLCREALAKKGLRGRDLDRVIMVGGTSLFPALREAVHAELEAELEMSIDPVTVVARGAAVYAGTKRLRSAPVPLASTGEFSAELEYEPIGTTDEPEVLGRIAGQAGVVLVGHTIRIRETKSNWDSGMLRVTAEGHFMALVHAEAGRRNEYTLELCDERGNACKLTPSTFHYTMGRPPTAMTMSHDIGIAQADNTVDQIFAQGTATPARGRSKHRTVEAIRAGHATDEIRIPVVEGRHPRADRNRLIGYIEIPATGIRRDLPVGTEVQIFVLATESGTLELSAEIPLLEEEFKGVFKTEREVTPVADLDQRFEDACKRRREYSSRGQKVEDAQALQLLSRIEAEETEAQVRDHLVQARADRNHIPEAERRLLDFTAALDQVEEALRWPDLVANANFELADAERLIGKYGSASEKDRWKALAAKVRDALAKHDPESLNAHVRDLTSLTWAVLLQQPGWWSNELQKVEADLDKLTDKAEAQRLIAQGRRAMSSDDVEGLKAAVRRLWDLGPKGSDGPRQTGAYGANTQKGL